MNKFGIVLSGGGAKGAYQIGAMKAIKEFNIDVLGYSGSSIGALNEALLFSQEITYCENIWKNIKLDDIFEINDYIFNGISTGEDLKNLINNHIDISKIQQSKIPLFVTICTNEERKEGRYILLNDKTKDEIVLLLLTSAALPIVYNKVSYNNQLCSDGGLFDNNPINPLYENGINNLILISMNHKFSLDNYYPNSEILIIKPSLDLKGLIEGTLNFDKNEILLRLELGYSDAKRCLNNYFGIPNKHTEEYDNTVILQNYNYNKLESKVNGTLEKTKDLFKKYDI